MRPGSVIVDLAVEQGGNCELSVPGQIVRKHGVTIIGLMNLPGMVPMNASEVYAKNLVNVLKEISKDGAVAWDLKNEIVAQALVTHMREVRHPGAREKLGMDPLAKA